MSNQDFGEYSASASRYLKEKQKQFLDAFKLGEFKSWDWDQDTGLVVFSNSSQIEIEVEVLLVGSWFKEPCLWAWAWSDLSLSKQLRSASLQIRELGEERDYKKLYTGRWQASKDLEAWKMTAIMAKELYAIGACRIQVENALVFLAVKSARKINRNKLLNLFRKT